MTAVGLTYQLSDYANCNGKIQLLFNQNKSLSAHTTSTNKLANKYEISIKAIEDKYNKSKSNNTVLREKLLSTEKANSTLLAQLKSKSTEIQQLINEKFQGSNRKTL